MLSCRPLRVLPSGSWACKTRGCPYHTPSYFRVSAIICSRPWTPPPLPPPPPPPRVGVGWVGGGWGGGVVVGWLGPNPPPPVGGGLGGGVVGWWGGWVVVVGWLGGWVVGVWFGVGLGLVGWFRVGSGLVQGWFAVGFGWVWVLVDLGLGLGLRRGCRVVWFRVGCCERCGGVGSRGKRGSGTEAAGLARYWTASPALPASSPRCG